MKHLSPFSVSAATINEYKMVTPTLAKITCTIVKSAGRDAVLASITGALKQAGTPVASSFRKLDDTTVIGFVASRYAPWKAWPPCPRTSVYCLPTCTWTTKTRRCGK